MHAESAASQDTLELLDAFVGFTWLSRVGEIVSSLTRLTVALFKIHRNKRSHHRDSSSRVSVFTTVSNSQTTILLFDE